MSSHATGSDVPWYLQPMRVHGGIQVVDQLAGDPWLGKHQCQGFARFADVIVDHSVKSRLVTQGLLQSRQGGVH